MIFIPWGHHKWTMRVSGTEQSESRIILSQGDYAGNTDGGQSARRHSQGVWSLGHCGGRPHTVPLRVTPIVPISGVHTHAVSSVMGSPTQSINDTSLWGQSIDDRAPLQGPLSSPTLLSLRWPRCEHLKLPDRWAQRLPGTGEHRGSQGQASTEASGDRWALRLLGTGEHWGLQGQVSTEAWGWGPRAPTEPGDLDDRLPTELPPDSLWVSREWLFKASRVLSDLLYRTLQHHGWI